MQMVELNDRIMCRTKSGNRICWMLTAKNGAPDFELRSLETPPGGNSS